MSTVWEEKYGCAKKYRCALDIYLMTVLSYSYGIIMDRAINATGHGSNVVDGLNKTGKNDLKEQMELIGKLATNNISILECFRVLQKTSQLNLQINLYKSSIINKS